MQAPLRIRTSTCGRWRDASHPCIRCTSGRMGVPRWKRSLKRSDESIVGRGTRVFGLHQVDDSRTWHAVVARVARRRSLILVEACLLLTRKPELPFGSEVSRSNDGERTDRCLCLAPIPGFETLSNELHGSRGSIAPFSSPARVAWGRKRSHGRCTCSVIASVGRF